jgi:two-component system, OmpR family, response regulator
MRFVTQVQEKPDTQTLQGKRILIVEDYPLMGEILSDALSVYGHASHVLTGRDALEQIEHKAPDVILLDLNLPDMNGLEVVKFVRRNEKTSRIPVLAMSGTVMNHKKCLELGCNDFIHKPFSLPALLARLSALTPGPILIP